MDLFELEKKLLAAARCNPPGDQVPYAFETRIMARLTSATRIDEWTWWTRAFWRAAAACAAVAMLCSAWSWLPPVPRTSNPANDLHQPVGPSVVAPDLTGCARH